MGNWEAGDSLPWAEDRVERDRSLAGATITGNATRAAASPATACDTSLEEKLSGYAYPEAKRAMVKNFAARKAVEKTRGGKVKKSTFPPRLEIPQTPAGFPLSQQLRLLLSTRRTVVEQMGTFLMR